MADFLCRICTFVYKRCFYCPIEWIKIIFVFVDFVANILNGVFQVLFSGLPFYWSLKYKQNVPLGRSLIVLVDSGSVLQCIKILSNKR